jgi:hypothetical protein
VKTPAQKARENKKKKTQLEENHTIFDVKTPAQKARENKKEKTQLEENHKKTDSLKHQKQSKSKAKLAEKDTSIQNVEKKYRLFYYFCIVHFGIAIAYLLFLLTH